MIINLLPDFDLLEPVVSSAGEMVEQLALVPAHEQRIEQTEAARAMATIPAVKAWYVAAVRETQYEATNLNGETYDYQ